VSRVHVLIGYEPLDDEAREHIWEAMFRKLKEDYKNGGMKIEYDYDAKQYVKKSKEVMALRWNGREIRNGKYNIC
jgi:ATP-dependent Clp protease ATP-binding subunit ClpA